VNHGFGAHHAESELGRARSDGGQVRQQVITTLGLFVKLQANGRLERPRRSGAH
jgi:hypothetical protein